MTNNASLVLLTVRGTLVPASLEAACKLHNETAGSQQGIAAARALGDLSHKVYAPVTKAPGAKDGELLFIDTWQSPQGIGQFFGNEHVQTQAKAMFAQKDATIWMPAKNAFGFDLPAPASKNERYVGIVRGPIKSPDVAIDAFRGALESHIVDARRAGQLSHQLYFKIPMPGEPDVPELLGVDVWYDAQGMQDFYKTLSGFEKAFAGAPAMSVWEAAKGGVWSEW